MKACPKSKAGASLVEVTLAIVLLSLLAIAAGAGLHHARGLAVVQKARRAALDVACARLEAVRGAAYGTVRPPANNYTSYYLSRTGSVWSVTSSDPNEQAVINGTSRPTTTLVQYVDTDGGSASYDAIRVTATVQYGPGAQDVVVLRSLRTL